MNSVQKTARFAGLLYLIVAISGGFAHLVVRQSVIAVGDAAATADNIMAHETLFRIGFLSDLLNTVCFLLLPLVLYTFLKPVNPIHAVLMVVFVLMAVPIMCLNMLNHFAALYILTDGDYLNVFAPDQVDALALLFLDLHKYGYLIAQIFFGAWLFPLGYLVYKSGYFPKILGVLLMLAPVGYLIDFLVLFLSPSAEEITYPGLALAAIAEISFCLWLLVKGVNTAKLPSTSIHESASLLPA